MRDMLHHYIGGQWVRSDGGIPYAVINPATEEACAQAIMGSAADVDRAVAAARAAFADFSRSSIAARQHLLERISAAYEAHMDDIAAAISREMGAPIDFARQAQAPAGLDHFRTAARILPDFPFQEMLGAGRVVHEPIGIVGMITPWNWPINQIAAKVAPAIAAGNTMVLKPSESCPANAVILAEIMAEAGVPPGVFNLVLGDGPTVGQAIAAHGDIAMISFTGSTRAGIAVAIAAAPTVKRVHQELGGKAPHLVLEGADLDAMARPGLLGIINNSGQSCIAPTRLLVHESQKSALESYVAQMLVDTAVGDPAMPGAHIGPLVSAAQYDRVQSLIQSAIDAGARLLTGGTGRPTGLDRGYYVRPTLFTDITPDMRIVREEIFGPVATIQSYATLEEAIAMANDTPYGLSATISGDPVIAARIAPQLRAGLVTVNGYAPDSEAPFGGYRQSGNGREHGRYGMAEYMEVKTILGA